jgi:hypothetical protein
VLVEAAAEQNLAAVRRERDVPPLAATEALQAEYDRSMDNPIGRSRDEEWVAALEGAVRDLDRFPAPGLAEMVESGAWPRRGALLLEQRRVGEFGAGEPLLLVARTTAGLERFEPRTRAWLRVAGPGEELQLALATLAGLSDDDLLRLKTGSTDDGADTAGTVWLLSVITADGRRRQVGVYEANWADPVFSRVSSALDTLRDEPQQ